MKVGGSRFVGIAAACVVWLAAASSASAGEVAAKAAEAESLLEAGKVKEAVASFDASVEAFWKAAPLSFRTVLFADSVSGYGEYAAHDGATFAPKSELKIYAEPVGFGWQPVDDGHRIAFSTEIEIRNADGVIFAKSPAPAVLEKIGRSPSRDFHLTVSFQLPDLRPGAYRLLMNVTDEASGKSAQIELPLTIS